MFAYTIWLFRYLGVRVQPTLVNAAIQTELKWWSYQRVDPPTAVPAPVERSDTAAAPPIAVALSNGRGFHLPGCHHTTKLTSESQGHDVLKAGLVSSQR